jgi:hypothetical protein
MEMELYNTTDKTKVIPKFNYEGKMTMGPHESKKIEDYMGTFFKPYARVGIVVRPVARVGSFKIGDKVEPEVEEVIKEDVTSNQSIVDEVKTGEEPIPEKEDMAESTAVEEPEVKEEETVEEVKESEKKYSKDKLSSMSVKNLRLLADTMGADVSQYNKKADIVKALIDFQSK